MISCFCSMPWSIVWPFVQSNCYCLGTSMYIYTYLYIHVHMCIYIYYTYKVYTCVYMMCVYIYTHFICIYIYIIITEHLLSSGLLEDILIRKTYFASICFCRLRNAAKKSTRIARRLSWWRYMIGTPWPTRLCWVGLMKATRPASRSLQPGRHTWPDLCEYSMRIGSAKEMPSPRNNA